MIHFALKCDQGHGFESWFQSSEAFDKLLSAGHVACSVCGSTRVEKALMAPSVRASRDTPAPAGRPAPQAGPLSAPGSDAEHAIAELRRKFEESATWVGGNFATEARAIHAGEKPERPIYGEAKPDEARALIEDGVPVLPLPFAPGRKTN